MKKPFKHIAKDHRRCLVCNKNLKANLIFKNPDADMCYRHHKMRIGHYEPDIKYKNYVNQHKA